MLITMHQGVELKLQGHHTKMNSQSPPTADEDLQVKGIIQSIKKIKTQNTEQQKPVMLSRYCEVCRDTMMVKVCLRIQCSNHL